MKAHLLALFLLFSMSLSLQADEPGACIEEHDLRTRLEEVLERIDSVVAHRQHYINAKQAEIDGIKNKRTVYQTSGDQFNYYNLLFNEYLKFDSDSAEHYALCAMEVARDSTDILHSRMDYLFATLLRGETIGVEGQLDSLAHSSHFTEELRFYYLVLRMEYAIRMSKLNLNSRMLKSDELCLSTWQKYGHQMPQRHWATLYYRQLTTMSEPAQVLEKNLRLAPFPSLQASMIGIALARTYYKMGDTERYYYHLALSALSDLMLANRDAQSLPELVLTPCIDPTSKRASAYALACAENVKHYRDTRRAMNVANIHASITREYEARLEQQAKRLRTYTWLLSISLGLLIVAVWIILYRHRKLKLMFKEREEMNRQLSDAVSQEKKTKEMLRESNAELAYEISQRDHHLLSAYQLVSQYIHDVAAFKRAVNNLIAAGNVSKAKRELSSDADEEKYLAHFYEQFDETFLLAHPDFPERFNALLRPEAQIPLSGEGVLTPTQRIYALVSIGITDSLSIADFLHYSSQTIYNYRLRARHSAAIPEKEFSATVAEMYL